MGVKRTEFENRTQGHVGAVKLNRKDDAVGVGVAPGARVFLSDEEVQLTEQAVAHAEDSPFQVREIVHRDQATGDEIARFRAAPLTKVSAQTASRRRATAG